jgi:hypothetical protein
MTGHKSENFCAQKERPIELDLGTKLNLSAEKT